MEAYFAEDDAANEGIEALLGFQDLNHVFALQGVGPHDRQLQQAMAFMLNSGGGVKQSNSPPGSPSRSHTGSPLSSLLHKIEDLQRLLLQLVAQADVNNKTATTGIEKLVDQLMVVAKGMLLQQQQQQAVLLPNTSAAAAFNEHYCSSSSSNLFVEDFSVDIAGGLRDFAATEETLVAEQFQPEKQYISYLASLADEVQDPVLLVAGPTTAAAAKEEEEEAEGDSLPPGSYDLIELDAMEILAEHTHFCEICGKGFKRDANLRMHMRGHGDEYKTAAALARPDKAAQDSQQQQQQQETTKRYSCPLVGCKRNKLHGKFVPLKTVLCVKNHYRRTHCPKMLTCSKCHAKRFSVVADLRTHEKHCGREKWQCSCGTTFSRKDKLLGHLGLFVGHTPVMPGSSDLGRPAPRWGFDLGNPAPRFAPRLRYNNVNGVQQQHVNAGNSSTSEQGSVEEAVVSWSILASN